MDTKVQMTKGRATAPSHQEILGSCQITEVCQRLVMSILLEICLVVKDDGIYILPALLMKMWLELKATVLWGMAQEEAAQVRF